MESAVVGSSELTSLVREIAEFLPSQGPLDVFIHHNTLHHFEHLPFEEAVEAAARVYHAAPYLSESRYQKEYQSGRISDRDLSHVFSDLSFLTDINPPLMSQEEFLRLVLLTAPSLRTRHTIQWVLGEGEEIEEWVRDENNKDSLRALFARDRAWLHNERNQATFQRVCKELAAGLPRGWKRFEGLVVQELHEFVGAHEIVDGQRVSARFLWLNCLRLVAEFPCREQEEFPMQAEESLQKRLSESLVNPYLIRFCAAFLDQGIASWHLSHREEGFLQAFFHHLTHDSFERPWWLHGDSAELVQRCSGKKPVEVLQHFLELLEVKRHNTRDFLLTQSLSLKGWAGMLHVFESRLDLQPQSERAHQDTFLEYLAVRCALRGLPAR